MLELDGLRLRLGGFTLEADARIAPGGIVALMGPSGSGKSTLLSALAGFLAPEAGRVRIAGRDVTGDAPGNRPVSILFQDLNLFPHLTAAQNVGLGLRPTLRLTPDEAAARDAALARVGLGGLGGRLPRDLSGGQQGRAALARALLRARPWLLLDEPFSALGPALRREMLGLVAEVAEGGPTVLMVTHDPADARAVAARTAFVADGRLHPPAPTDTLLADPPPALRDYLGG